MVLLYCSAEHLWRHSGMNGTPLEGNGQCHNFFVPHHLMILSPLENPLGEGNPCVPAPPGSVGQSTGHLF